MDDATVNPLLEALHNPDEEVRNQATEQLWLLWFSQKGQTGLELINRSQLYLRDGETEKAEALLTELIDTQPDFAEAWNRRAVIYYMQGRYPEATADCQAVVKLNPIHFGAWHGLGLCYAAMGQHRDAIQSFHKALEIQPYALINQRLILECTARLS